MSFVYPEAERLAITEAMYEHRELHGTTYADLSETFNLGRSTVTDWLKRAGLYTPTNLPPHNWTAKEDHLLALDITAGATGQEICEIVPGVPYSSMLNRKGRLQRQGRIR